MRAKPVLKSSEPFRRPLTPDEEFTVIDPERMIFLFSFSEGECHLKLTGTCSLERKAPDRGRDKGEESDYDFCPRLLRSMKRHGLYPVLHVDLIKSRCGHFEFNDGQHRICIAKRKGYLIEALLTESHRDCDVCEGRPDADDELR